jgi:hypothetical protein
MQLSELGLLQYLGERFPFLETMRGVQLLVEGREEFAVILIRHSPPRGDDGVRASS